MSWKAIRPIKPSTGRVLSCRDGEVEPRLASDACLVLVCYKTEVGVAPAVVSFGSKDEPRRY